MVQFIPLWQNCPSCVWRQYVINYGNVPYHEAQCSVLRVCLYCTCTADREDHVAEHGVRRRHAAIRTLSSRRRDVCRSTTQNCIEEASHWMSANRLKLNADKTELLWAGSLRGPRLCWEALVRPCSLELKWSRRVTKSVSLA